MRLSIDERGGLGRMFTKTADCGRYFIRLIETAEQESVRFVNGSFGREVTIKGPSLGVEIARVRRLYQVRGGKN